MIIYGYAVDTMYGNSGEFLVKVRIPNIHGPLSQKQYKGKKVRNYTKDEDLPWYPSLLLPYTPNYGSVVVLESINQATAEWLVIGLTGGYYSEGSDRVG